MLKLLKADLYRVTHKKGFYAFTLFCTVLFSLIIVLVGPSKLTSEDYITFSSIIIMMSPLIIGVFVYSLLYGDDLKNKNSQAILGFGYTRANIVLRKFFIFIVLTLLAFAYFYLLININAIIFGFKIGAQQQKHILGSMVSKASLIVIYAAITSLVAYYSQSATTSIVLFVLLVTGTLNMILSLILSQGPIVKLIGDLTPYLVTSLMGAIESKYTLDGIVWMKEIGFLMMYVVVALVGSIYLFENKELEF